MLKKTWLISLVLAIIGFLVCFSSWRLLSPSYLTFSDAAKFADIARNYVSGQGFGSSFSPWSLKALELERIWPVSWGSPLQPLLLSIAFKFLGVKDWVVILTSGSFYLAGAVGLYFLGKKVFSDLVGIFASLAFIFDPVMLDYATSGASESFFIFELILAALLIVVNKKVSLFFGFLVLLLSYFTRPSAAIYIFGFVLFFIFLRFREKSQIIKAGGLVILGWLLIEVVLIKLSGHLFFYSPLMRFFVGITSFSPSAAATASLRGGGTNLVVGFKPLLSKLLYNLYNFYKLLPNILSPYLASFFFLSLFRWEKEREKRAFRLVVLLMVAMTFIASAAFLPIYRYLHPVIPFIYLLAIEMLVWTASQLITSFKLPMVRKVKRGTFVFLVSFSLIFVFIIGQTTGKIFLDSRYQKAHTNQDKPPVYVQLSWLLKENTKYDDLVITNLDTWGSWYGERRTIWFPLEPRHLIPREGEETKIDAIYLTSYKMDDESYYLGEEWRKIFSQPEALEDSFIGQNFELAGEFEIAPEETYEREGGRAILLIRKQ